MSEEKTITEAMKKLRIVEKRMEGNSELIQRYSSMLNTEKPYFESEDRQTKEVKSLIKANQDLMVEYLDLKQKIEYTNLYTTVEIEGKKYSVSELLIIKRVLAKKMLQTFNSLNENAAESRRSRSFAGGVDAGGNRPQVVRLYKEEDKMASLKKWQYLYDNITTRLETINAMSPLLSLPPVQQS